MFIIRGPYVKTGVLHRSGSVLVLTHGFRGSAELRIHCHPRGCIWKQVLLVIISSAGVNIVRGDTS